VTESNPAWVPRFQGARGLKMRAGICNIPECLHLLMTTEQISLSTVSRHAYVIMMQTPIKGNMMNIYRKRVEITVNRSPFCQLGNSQRGMCPELLVACLLLAHLLKGLISFSYQTLEANKAVRLSVLAIHSFSTAFLPQTLLLL
jgi:hypothetical protein